MRSVACSTPAQFDWHSDVILANLREASELVALTKWLPAEMSPVSLIHLDESNVAFSCSAKQVL